MDYLLPYQLQHFNRVVSTTIVLRGNDFVVSEASSTAIQLDVAANLRDKGGMVDASKENIAKGNTSSTLRGVELSLMESDKEHLPTAKTDPLLAYLIPRVSLISCSIFEFLVESPRDSDFLGVVIGTTSDQSCLIVNTPSKEKDKGDTILHMHPFLATICSVSFQLAAHLAALLKEFQG